ncbi:Disease resistance RPP13-like protein 4 [Glycine soja]
MSIRTNPMKAVPTLLKRLVTVEKQANLNDLKSELTKIKDLFWMVKKNEEELLDTLTVVDDVKLKQREEVNRTLPSSPELEDLQMFKRDSPEHHIEVESEEFLKELKHQKDLWYLSLHGMSRISELPLSIVELERLEILDLKAYHNLANDIASSRKFKHLDLSRCYLLERMPKGIEKLTKLQVLNGFVISSSSKTPCKISDLANLKKLKQLIIHIASTGANIQNEEFQSL